MTPKEKALELIDKFTYWNTSEAEREGIKSALIAVDEILEYVPQFEYGQGEKTTTTEYEYLQEVKQEIQKI